MKFTTTKAVAITSTTPCTTRYSRLKIDSTASCPTPGIAKKYSTMTEPPMRVPKLMPNTVSSENDDGRSACRSRMCQVGQALGAGHEHEVLLQRGDEVAAEQARVDGGQAGGEHRDRQRDRAEVLARAPPGPVMRS